MNKCIIVDDEPAAHYVLLNYIERNTALTLEKQCFNAVEALAYLRDNKTDLIFLDIDMPEINGIEFLKMLPNRPATILTTAYTEYALESYEYGVVDYLLKPIGYPRFLKAVERFLAYRELSARPEEAKTIAVKMDGRTHDIELSRIRLIQSLGNYVKVITDDKTYLATSTLQKFLQEIPASRFIRIHKSYVVPVADITSYADGYVEVPGNRLPVGITFRRMLSERLGD